MKVYCTSCGEVIEENARFCSNCGISLTDSINRKSDNEWSNTTKTAATVGGTILGAYALSNLFRGLFYRPYHHHHHHPMGPRHHHHHGHR